MTADFQIGIIGSGPAGLSAALQAVKCKLSHIVLESAAQPAQTIRHYQKNKWVMAEPSILPLRSALPFQAASRETVLESWEKILKTTPVNLRCNAELVEITGQKGCFQLHLKSGEMISVEQIVLAIGMQGNLRKLDEKILETNGHIHYELTDPNQWSRQTILVIGAGDAAIENALALSENNQVIIVNRREEFSRAKPANNDLILKAIHQETIECYYRTIPIKIISQQKQLKVTLQTLEGETHLLVDRIIARLGASPPREFLEKCGVRFGSPDPSAPPILSATYETTVAGLYIIGSLAGYPLIKQAVNQGFEVIEFIQGHDVAPADEPILYEKFKNLPAFHSVNASLDMIRFTLPLLSSLTVLQLRELLIDSTIRTPQPNEQIFRYNDYSDSFFSIIAGEVRVAINRDDPSQIITLRQGQFFGEMSLISGRRRQATVHAGSGQQCVLLETPRRAMLRLINSVDAVKRSIDQMFVLRAIQAHFAPEIPASDLAAIVHTAKIQPFDANSIIFKEGDTGDSLHLIRSGSVTLSKIIANQEVILSYVSAGNYIGETALLSELPRAFTARAAVATETIRLDSQAFSALLERSTTLRQRLEARFHHNLTRQVQMENQPQTGNLIAFLVAQGLGEATDVLLIDESLCIHCDNCERACAEVHHGTSRLDRQAGPTFNTIHVPTSCRHCEHPHCMKDCPPDAIHRAENGEVFIADNCIGCGHCEKNCPYGVIQMAHPNRPKNHLWRWVFFGWGNEPGRELFSEISSLNHKAKAVKCDMCKGLKNGAACVKACPTGAAMRVSPEQFLSLATI
ncbi:MAG: hypothetical protein RIT27_164 [Pseudomonadota bacterium]|jgi:thioredoxin reductase/Fe-S-cluster-containing hydrogenase component 2/CRP-like cAMP-binding protein